MESAFRAAEQRLWAEAGATPTERRVYLPGDGINVRVQEFGAGAPVLFIHGGPGATGGVWAFLAARLPEFRCILVDRRRPCSTSPTPWRNTRRPCARNSARWQASVPCAASRRRSPSAMRSSRTSARRQ